MATKYKIDMWQNSIDNADYLSAYYKTTWWPFWRFCVDHPLCDSIKKPN